MLQVLFIYDMYVINVDNKNVYKNEDKDMRTKTFLEENKQIKICETSNGTIIKMYNCGRLSYNFNYRNYEFDNVVAMYRNNTLVY